MTNYGSSYSIKDCFISMNNYTYRRFLSWHLSSLGLSTTYSKLKICRSLNWSLLQHNYEAKSNGQWEETIFCGWSIDHQKLDCANVQKTVVQKPVETGGSLLFSNKTVQHSKNVFNLQSAVNVKVLNNKPNGIQMLV